MISHDLVGPRMAGPGMRYWELARVLAQHCPVTLAAPEGSRSLDPSSGVRVAPYARKDAGRMRELVEPAEVVVVPGDTLVEFPFLLSTSKYKVMDGYDPHTFESLAWNQGRPLEVHHHEQTGLTCQAVVNRQADQQPGHKTQNGKIE